jgi:hypothetical protein
LLRSCKRRGIRAPVLAVGDGALGFWAAIRDVFPETREQRCWLHVGANVLNALPKSAQPGARAALAEIYNAENRERAAKAVKAFETDSSTKWPKAVERVTDNLDMLTAFYDYPAEHWIHLRTTNPIESTFATVRLRTRVTRDPAPAPPAWRWPSKSSNPPRPTGARSTHPTWSPWSAPARGSRTANSSNDPTSQEVISKPRDQGGHEAGRHVGQRELQGQVQLLDGVGCMDGLRHAGWAGR